uniref:Uncharacterized protein n=1 Tax=Biomphalaria glabrata TaxID=6526 RepID=A0A2C9KB53_BIOGL
MLQKDSSNRSEMLQKDSSNRSQMLQKDPRSTRKDRSTNEAFINRITTINIYLIAELSEIIFFFINQTNLVDTSINFDSLDYKDPWYPHIREEETLGSLDLRSQEAPFNLAAHVSPLDQIPSPLNGDTPSDPPSDLPSDLPLNPPSDPPSDPPFYPLYSSIHIRIDSFQKWGYSNILDPNTLAQEGFVYTGYSDCVRCFQCGLGLRSWKLGDDVLVEHTKFRPSCSLLQSILARRHIQSTDSSVQNNSEVESRENVNENIAKVTATEFGPTEATSCTPLNERNINLVQERGLVERASTRELTDQEISDTEPSYSGLSTSPAAPSQIDYSNQMARRESFNSWSGQCPLNPDVLSLFYYFIGPDFCFKCWRCKIVIHINGDEEGLPRLRLELNEGRPICCLCYHRLPRLSSQSGVVSQDHDRGEDEDLSEET